MTVKEIPLTRIDCPTCIPTLEKALMQVEGVKDARGNYIKKTLRVKYDPDVVGLPKIEKAIEDIGYRVAYKKYPSVFDRIKGLFEGDKAAEVEVLDGDNNVVDGATVTGEWSVAIGGVTTGVTNDVGVTALTSPEAKAPRNGGGLVFVLTIVNVEKSGHTYDPTEPDVLEIQW